VRAVAEPVRAEFHSRVRDELLDVEEFSCLAEAQVVIADWRRDYNQRRPHSALGMLPRRVRGRVDDDDRAVSQGMTAPGVRASAPRLSPHLLPGSRPVRKTTVKLNRLLAPQGTHANPATDVRPDR
jgi:hypothetical protein